MPSLGCDAPFLLIFEHACHLTPLSVCRQVLVGVQGLSINEDDLSFLACGIGRSNAILFSNQWQVCASIDEIDPHSCTATVRDSSVNFRFGTEMKLFNVFGLVNLFGMLFFSGIALVMSPPGVRGLCILD